MKKVHILEGSESDGTRIYACGRRAPKGTGGPSVGRAVLETHGQNVTCVPCTNKYGLVLALIERKRLDPDAPDAIAMPKRSTT